MRLILARHGNTFSAGTTPVWVGKHEDLPLVDTGLAQAEHLGNCLLRAHMQLTAAYCSALQRTRVYAATALAHSNSTLIPNVDARLDELDFGNWSGLSTAQISAKFGTQALDAWERHSEWPTTATWGASEEMIRAQVQDFCRMLVAQYADDATVLVVSSNGRLRYFLHCVEGAFARQIDQQNFKVRTGNICSLTYTGANAAGWTLNFWNQLPAVGLNVN